MVWIYERTKCRPDLSLGSHKNTATILLLATKFTYTGTVKLKTALNALEHTGPV